MSDKINEFRNWLGNMSYGFENDFLNVDKSKINNLLSDSEIETID
tara:strand:+ start:89 stop:223 length:135 start_codon:yes stop_codon:yes gene_type:complete